MHLKHLWLRETKLLWILCLILLFPHNGLSWGNQPILPHHNLTMTLQPKTHSLTAEDTITFHNPVGLPEYLELTLNKNLVIDEILLNGSIIAVKENLNKQYAHDTIARLRIPLHEKRKIVSSPSITIRYHGMIADHPKGTPGLRFTKPDNTTGYIGPEGVYLTSETQWFPSMMNGLATFHLRATVPSGWESVTQGKETSHVVSQGQTISEWNIPSPSETLTVAANRFIKKERQWNGITIGTYLFPEDAQLADQYLDATALYLAMYTTLLGPYPFSKFAVVENFFPSGIGLPSFTLLGNRIIKRGYTQPYSLGHEIVHSWFGNSVFNHFSTGNWVEGLTTYLSNYYYEEVHAVAGTALKKRQHMFFEYNLYATEEQEYPIRKFHHKETRIDNAIGYQKTAMLFHMLRQEVGDKNFFNAIRTLIKESTGAHAAWDTIEQVFSKTTGKDLNWFFQQWVERSGSPSLSIANTEVKADTEHPGQFIVNITLVQQEPHYRLSLPAILQLTNGATHHAVITMNDKEQTIQVSTPARPTRLVIDPDFMVLRRLNRSQIPPMLNTWATDGQQAIWLDENISTEDREAYQPVLHRLRSQGLEPVIKADRQGRLKEKSLLILSRPLKNNLGQQGLSGCGNIVEVGDDWIIVQGKKFEGSNIAWLVSCPHPDNPNHVVSIFYGFSPSAISHVARLLFFYGWDSYLVFQNGKVLTRGLFDPPANDLDVLLNAA